ncbi:MAG: class II fructose-bisphosphate aldolase [Methanobacteriota archaeon]
MDDIDFTEPVWGKDLFEAIRGKPHSIMAANIRTKASLQGIMEAAQETGSPVLFEIAMSELGYTGFTPQSFVETIKAEAKRLGFDQPYAIHGDHITIKENTPEAVQKAEDLLNAQIDAGFTSFAIDASHCFDVNAPTKREALRDNIEITTRLARIIQERAPRASIEVEVGEIGHKDKATGNQEITTVEEAVAFVSGLAENGINPDLLAVHNGTEHGNAFDAQGNPVPQLGIDLQRTREVTDAIAEHKLVGITQHGTTGTALEHLSKFVDAGIKKVNVATHFQNIVMDTVPFRPEIDEWCLTSPDIAKHRAAEEAKLDPGMDPAKREQVLIGKLIKHANLGFYDRLQPEALGPELMHAITEQTRADSIDFFERFQSAGASVLVSDHLIHNTGMDDLTGGLKPKKRILE